MPDRYAVIGHPIAHSKSPWIHARFALQTGEDIAYGALLAPLDGFEQTLYEFRAAGANGANVTLPFKAQACRLATQLSERARAAEAVNTLIFRGAQIHGDNTDGYGLTRDLGANLGFAIAGRRVLLLGAGGAARGVLLPLLSEQPAALVIANRTIEKAQLLAERFAGLVGDRHVHIAASSYAALAGERFDLVINATSAGLTDAPLPLPARIFASGSLAYEMVYGRETAFMRQARTDGAVTIADGLGMLVEQAAEAFFLWRGVRPETASVRAALRAV